MDISIRCMENLKEVKIIQHDIKKMIKEIKEIQELDGGQIDSQFVDVAKEISNLSQSLSGAVAHINETVLYAQKLENAYGQGDGYVTLAQVMLAFQKVTIAFESLLTLRKKTIIIYQNATTILA